MQIKITYLVMITLIGLMIGTTFYVVITTQQTRMLHFDIGCNNTNETIIVDFARIDCNMWNLRNFTMI